MAKLVVRDPFADFGDLVEQAFGRGWAEPFGRLAGARQAASASSMPVNVYDTEDGVGIEAWVPGFSSEEIDVTFEDGQLTLRAEHRAERAAQGDGGAEDGSAAAGRRYRRREIQHTVLERSFHIGGDFDAEAISGDLRNGVLDLQLRRAKRSESRRIPISSD